jgi:hypothetical protein
MAVGLHRLNPRWGRLFPQLSVVCRTFERTELLGLDPTTLKGDAGRLTTTPQWIYDSLRSDILEPMYLQQFTVYMFDRLFAQTCLNEFLCKLLQINTLKATYSTFTFSHTADLCLAVGSNNIYKFIIKKQPITYNTTHQAVWVKHKGLHTDSISYYSTAHAQMKLQPSSTTKLRV